MLIISFGYNVVNDIIYGRNLARNDAWADFLISHVKLINFQF